MRRFRLSESPWSTAIVGGRRGKFRVRSPRGGANRESDLHARVQSRTFRTGAPRSPAAESAGSGSLAAATSSPNGNCSR
eukprot:15433522-Alexandrium_andersonii.AAC.1